MNSGDDRDAKRTQSRSCRVETLGEAAVDELAPREAGTASTEVRSRAERPSLRGKNGTTDASLLEEIASALEEVTEQLRSRDEQPCLS